MGQTSSAQLQQSIFVELPDESPDLVLPPPVIVQEASGHPIMTPCSTSMLKRCLSSEAGSVEPQGQEKDGSSGCWGSEATTVPVPSGEAIASAIRTNPVPSVSPLSTACNGVPDSG